MSFVTKYEQTLLKLFMIPVSKNHDVEIDHYNHTKGLISLGSCSVLLFILVFNLVFSPSSFPHPNNVFADDMMGDSNGGGSDSGDSGGGDSGDGGENENDDGSNDMPKDSPPTTDALTAGGSDNDDDDGNDDDINNGPTTEDAPQTADTVTTNKPECQKGQEYYLFSSGCQPTSAVAVCPSSYSSTEDFSITRGILNRDYEIKTDVVETRQFLIYQVADGDRILQGQIQKILVFLVNKLPGPPHQILVYLKEMDRFLKQENAWGMAASRLPGPKQDGSSVVTILNLNGVRDPEGKLVPGAVEQDTKYNAQNIPTRTDSYDRSQNVVSTTAYDAKSGNPTYTQTFATNGDLRGTAPYSYNAQNKLTQLFHLDPQNNLLDRTVNTYTPNNLPRTARPMIAIINLPVRLFMLEEIPSK